MEIWMDEWRNGGMDELMDGGMDGWSKTTQHF